MLGAAAARPAEDEAARWRAHRHERHGTKRAPAQFSPQTGQRHVTPAAARLCTRGLFVAWSLVPSSRTFLMTQGRVCQNAPLRSLTSLPAPPLSSRAWCWSDSRSSGAPFALGILQSKRHLGNSAPYEPRSVPSRDTAVSETTIVLALALC